METQDLSQTPARPAERPGKLDQSIRKLEGGGVDRPELVQYQHLDSCVVSSYHS